MAENEVTIEIKGPPSYSDVISREQARAIVAFLVAGVPLGPTPSEPLDQYSQSRGNANEFTSMPQSPSAAILAANPKTNAEKIVVLAKYLLAESRSDSFTLDELRTQFTRARQTMPKNLKRDLDSAVANGWVHEASSGQFILTTDTDEVFALGLEVLRSKRPTTRKTRATSKPRTAKVPEVFAGVSELPTSVSGVPSYGQIKKKKDKMLWALMLSLNMGIKSLSPSAIEWLTDQLGEAVLAKHVGVHYGYLYKDGLVNRVIADKTIRITEKGQAYLKAMAQGTASV